MAVTSVPAPQRSTAPAGEAESPSVLLVDDEEDVRYLARLQVERVGGFRVVGEASDGLEAIELAERLQPSIVLLDVMMPRMDGFTALPELLVASPSSMIVMLSALNASTNEAPALRAGAFAYLEKEVLGRDPHGHLTQLFARFQRALVGETVWAPERPPR